MAAGEDGFAREHGCGMRRRGRLGLFLTTVSELTASADLRSIIPKAGCQVLQRTGMSTDLPSRHARQCFYT
jgi:hypothetical protein